MVLTISQGAKRPASHPSSQVSAYASTHLIFKGLRDVILFKKKYTNKNQKIHIIISCNRFRSHIPTYTKQCLFVFRSTETFSYCLVFLINQYFQTIFMILGIQISITGCLHSIFIPQSCQKNHYQACPQFLS